MTEIHGLSRGELPHAMKMATSATSTEVVDWMEERYISEAFGRTPQTDPQLGVEVLYTSWMSTLYGTIAPR